MAKKDFSGQKFGLWTVIEQIDKPEHLKKIDRYWLCRCECGTEQIIIHSNLISVHSNACRKCSKTKHGKTESTEYTSWCGMLYRCMNENSDKYHHYGGRGITVCEQWIGNFEQFYADMGPKPAKEYSIDRIDNNGNYEPSNCKWATRRQQASNRRKKSNTGVVGVYFSKQRNKYVSSFNIKRKTIYLGIYKDFFEACCSRKSWESKYVC